MRNTYPRLLSEDNLFKYVDDTYHHSFDDGKTWIRCTCNDLSEKDENGSRHYLDDSCPVEAMFNKLDKEAIILEETIKEQQRFIEVTKAILYRKYNKMTKKQLYAIYYNTGKMPGYNPKCPYSTKEQLVKWAVKRFNQ